MKFTALVGLAVSLVAAPLEAQSSPSILAARAAGQIGERFDGYLGYAAGVSPSVRTQVDAVNIRRRSLFTSLAARNGASPREVGITAGCQLLADVGIGDVYLLADNVWRQRGPGQAVAVPAYCRR